MTLSKGNESVDVEVLVDDLSDLIANRTSWISKIYTLRWDSNSLSDMQITQDVFG